MKRCPQPHGLFILALLALIVCAPLYARAQKPTPTPARTRATPTPSPTPKKKKVPPGAKGFEQYAGRDASDKLVTGAATRGVGANRAQAALDEGLRQYKAQDLTKAAASFTRAIQLAPQWAEAHYSLAIVLNELDRWAEAAAEFQRTLDSNPDERIRLLATYNLGNAELDLGHYDKALVDFQQTTQLAPNEPTPHYNMALAHLGLKQPDEAVEQFKEAIRLKPDYAEAHYNLGVLYQQRGQKDEARAEQQRLSRLNPELARRLAALIKQ